MGVWLWLGPFLAVHVAALGPVPAGWDRVKAGLLEIEEQIAFQNTSAAKLRSRLSEFTAQQVLYRHKQRNILPRTPQKDTLAHQTTKLPHKIAINTRVDLTRQPDPSKGLLQRAMRRLAMLQGAVDAHRNKITELKRDAKLASFLLVATEHHISELNSRRQAYENKLLSLRRPLKANEIWVSGLVV